MPHRSDEHLLAAACCGDPAAERAAFDELVRRHERTVRHAAAAVCGWALADDAAQEAWADLWRARGRFDPARGTGPAWLRAVTRRRAVDLLRRRAAGQRAERALLAQPVPAPCPEAAGAEVLARERRAAVLAAVGALPAAQATAVLLHFGGELSHGAIATATGLPLGTVKGRLRLAAGRLRVALAEQAPA